MPIASTAGTTFPIKAEVNYLELPVGATQPIFFGNLAFQSGGYVFDSGTMGTAVLGFSFVGVFRGNITGGATDGTVYVEVDPPINLKFLTLSYGAGTPVLADVGKNVSAFPTIADPNAIQLASGTKWAIVGTVAKVLEPGVVGGRVIVRLAENQAVSA